MDRRCLTAEDPVVVVEADGVHGDHFVFGVVQHSDHDVTVLINRVPFKHELPL